jgi:hypothetical protein
MRTSCYCHYELFLFGFHDAAAKIIVCCAVALGQCDLGAALKWPTFFQLHAVFPISFRLTRTHTVVTTWFP